MSELLTALATLVLLLSGSVLGYRLQLWLPMHDRRTSSLNAVGLISTMLVTFAALVLGLMVTSVKADFDSANKALQTYGVSLLELDQRLREYGPQTRPIRTDLRAFTAAAIADTWPDKPRPSGQYPTGLHRFVTGKDESIELTALLHTIDRAVRSLGQVRPAGAEAATPEQLLLASSARDLLGQAERQRWDVVANNADTISWPFLALLMLWLATAFTTFGLIAPRDPLIWMAILLAALAVTSALYLVLDLDTQLTGLIRLSSLPLRDALAHMDQPGP